MGSSKYATGIMTFSTGTVARTAVTKMAAQVAVCCECRVVPVKETLEMLVGW